MSYRNGFAGHGVTMIMSTGCSALFRRLCMYSRRIANGISRRTLTALWLLLLSVFAAPVLLAAEDEGVAKTPIPTIKMANRAAPADKNALNPFDLLDMLLAGEYQRLDSKLSALQHGYEQGVVSEREIRRATWTFAHPVMAWGEQFAAWKASYPQSYFAHIASAQFQVTMSDALDGDESYIRKHPIRRQAEKEALERASADLQRAQVLSSRPVQALAMQMYIAKRQRDRPLLDKLLQQAMTLDDRALAPVFQYLGGLWSASLGKKGERAEFMDDAIEQLHEKGYKEQWLTMRQLQMFEKADWLYDDKKLTEALSLLQEITALGPYRNAYRKIAIINEDVNQPEAALTAINRALAIDPGNGWAYAIRSRIYRLLFETAKANEDLRLSAHLGHKWAMSVLSDALEKGEKGFKRDMDEAMYWNQRLAEYLDPLRQFSMGLFYDKGNGVARNYQEAAHWYRLAVAQNNANAQVNLGMLLWYGRGVEPDHEEAARLWRLAADQGVWQGQHNLKYFLDEDYELGSPDKGGNSRQGGSYGFRSSVLALFPFGAEIAGFLDLAVSKSVKLTGSDKGRMALAALAVFFAVSLLFCRRLLLLRSRRFGSAQERVDMFEEHLRAGEKILWHGECDKSMLLRIPVFNVALGYVLAVTALGLMMGGGEADAVKLIAIAGLLLLGVRIAIMAPFINGKRRLQRVYAFTDQRIMVLLRAPSNHLHAFEIGALREMSLYLADNGCGDIVFTCGDDDLADPNRWIRTMAFANDYNMIDGIAGARAVHDNLRRLAMSAAKERRRQGPDPVAFNLSPS